MNLGFNMSVTLSAVGQVIVASLLFLSTSGRANEPVQPVSEPPMQQANEILVEKANEAAVEETIVSEDASKLAKILAETLTYHALFEQSVYRENSSTPEITKGEFIIQRPNHFRWQTNEPFEQSIIADGDNLWTYDPELEQATIQDQQAVLADSPLLLLTSSVESLVEAFDIVQVNNGKGEMEKDDVKQLLFSLTPRQNSLFESVHILIENDHIKEFFLLDTLGGRSGVVFNEIKLNQKIDMKSFIFVPPEGIDLIDSRAPALN